MLENSWTPKQTWYCLFGFQIHSYRKKIAKMLLHVYNDAKRGTLLAWSYPSRHIAELIGQSIDIQSPHVNFVPTEADLQYVTPHCHREFLLDIVKTDRQTFKGVLNDSLVVSLRTDGALDKQKIGNKRVMAKVVSNTGETKTYYLGFSESDSRGAKGLYHAVQEGASLSGISWDELFSKTSSVVTDGENTNTGAQNSLWKCLEDERVKSSSQLPLLKIWCAVHRSQLAYKDMAANVPEVKHIIADCKMTADYYRVSAKRMQELKSVSDVNMCQFPQVKDIRFTDRIRINS